MIRSNLATRPSYSRQGVLAWLAVAAALALAATAFNVGWAIRYSGNNTELASTASQDEARAAEMRRTAARLRAGVDGRQVDLAAREARQANGLIDRRTFSWTALFNQFETTLPDDVRITAVSPNIDRDGRIVLTVSVLARGVDDVNAFMERLDATGAFGSLRSTQEHTTEAGQIDSVLEMVYAAPPTGAAPAAGSTR